MTSNASAPTAALSAVLAVLLLGAGCSAGDGGANDVGDVVLRVGDQIDGAQTLLDAAGELDDVPYTIEWSTFTSGPPLLEAVHAGAVDIGQVGNTPPVFAAAAGSDMRIVAAFASSPDGTSIVVPTDSDIDSPEDLAGRSIAVTKGSSAHGQLLGVLEAEGLGFDDVDVNYVQPADALAAFSERQADAWAAWDPYIAQAEDRADAKILVNAEGYSNTFTFQVAAVDAVEDPTREAALEDYLGRIHRAVLWSAAHPDAYAKAWSKHTGLPEEVTRIAAERRSPTPRAIDKELIASEQDLADAFADAGEIPDAPVMADYVDDRFNDLVPDAAG
ncbi:aliphatic sulfonates ABC transporter substrate-binding protein [Nocardiopsis gilva YIM 90087]|uniref:Putative aliphatic sulfonates-binding protein n=1 Tax=Nocardiopsis gilva YIM 90087 TaxID=1235441 RepID=A0A223S3Y6_9ACTN|nr:ABC transporter substrate-binding protein [Nocardiopsis gilva]ASU82821.1 aliphatic sulfonates ABC transporter substrate-binding protein [Nocardiopsis gilva YIM 90087]